MRFLLVISIVLSLFSCKKAEDRRCFKSAGKTSIKEIELGEFSKLKLGPHIKFELQQDTLNKMVLSGPKNLLNFISSDIIDSELKVWNENKCNFLRSYKKFVTVRIHLKKIDQVHSEATKDLTCVNQLVCDDLIYEIVDGAGINYINVNANQLNGAVLTGYGTLDLIGSSNYLSLKVRSVGKVNAYGFTPLDSVNVFSSTSELVTVNANNAKLGAQISSTGSIWYKGTPNSIEYLQYGTGELVDKN